MGKKSSPKAPDPAKTARAQGRANVDAIQESARLNRYDTSTPFGNIRWHKPTDDPSTWEQRINLDPLDQRAIAQNRFTQNSMADAAKSLSSKIPTDKFSFSGLPDVNTYDTSSFQGVDVPQGSYGDSVNSVRDATYKQAMDLMNPEYDRRGRELETRLANQGLPMGGEAYDDEMSRFDRERNDATARAALNAVLAGGQEQSRLAGLDAQRFGQQSALRGMESAEALNTINAQNNARALSKEEQMTERSQPFNELAALLQGSPAMQTPQAQQTAQYQIAPADISGLIQSNYATKANQNNAKKGGTTGLLGNLGGAAISTWG